MKILFVVPYPVGEAPSQRFRFEQYFDVLRAHGHAFKVAPFLRGSNWKVIYQHGKMFAKMWKLIFGFLRRAALLFQVSGYDFIFIHREAAPLGPPVFEWIAAKVFQKRVIYDFDDAIWLTDNVHESLWLRGLRWRSKVGSICRWSFRVSCGNDYLAAYARNFNRQVVYNPSTIDMNRITPDLLSEKNETGKIVIGWTGSHSTLKYLESMMPVIKKLQDQAPHTELLVIADQQPLWDIKKLTFIRWQLATELQDLARIDIGIMPLPNDEWSKGKCGFKALQYLSVGKPAVVSPVGVNSQIIENNVNGFLCTSEAEWLDKLLYLVNDKSAREILGKNGREKVARDYSVTSNASNFLSLFEA